jgi:DNA primase catalytic core
MIPQQSIDQIFQIPIQDVLGKYISIKKSGSGYEACCPFHQEKTPSFKIYSKTNSYKCFGCGKGGNAIGFVMEKDGKSFPEACQAIAGSHGITIPKEPMTDQEMDDFKHRESMLTVNKLAMEYYRDQLYKEENALALEYVRSRWQDDTILLFDIGFAPDGWTGLIDWAKSKGIKQEIMMEVGLIRESEKQQGRLYDYFRARIMFPIHDRMGRVIGFTGRDFSGKEGTAKYLNSCDSPAYNKGVTLYGIQRAAPAIREKGFVYLVEGNADVIRMHEIGVENTVCSSGTSLTEDQISAIKKLHDKISINLMFDSDKAGVNATQKAAKMIIKNGIRCNVVPLPSDNGKADPDSFFTDHDQFTEFANNQLQDYIIAYARHLSAKAKAPDHKIKAIDEICELIIEMGSTGQELYIDQVSKLITPKKAWTDKIKELQKEREPEVVAEWIPKHVSLVDFERFGFYEDHNCYFFKTSKGIVKGCNFTLKPLFHIKSTQNAKRLYRMVNEHGSVEDLEILQKDMISLGAFKLVVESRGNFLWEATDTELNKLKRYLYEETKSCLEIVQLGWQRDGFYAWGNGIFNTKFTKVDEVGIVAHEDINYFLPAFSKMYAGEHGLFINERNFIHRSGSSINLKEYSEKLIQVFGNNASVALCFYFASIFRDVIVQRFSFFPILDLFGPKGAGKTELAVSIMAFFGKQGKGPNINNTTKAALADHVAQVANACVHIDEYKNTIEPEKIEFLKGLWDGTGRTRMNMDKDKKKETTAVDCAIILSGQEMPTADIALFSRLIYLTFTSYEYNDAAKAKFNELKQIEKIGLTHITNEILELRKQFIKNFSASYDQVAKDLMVAIGDVVIEDRIFRNWLLVLASYHAIRDKIEVSFTYAELIALSATQIQIQNRETKKSNEISTFWNIVGFLASDGAIQNGVDYKIELIKDLHTDTVDIEFPDMTNVIYIQMSRIFQMYRKHGKSAGEKILPVDSIDYYLRNDKRYLGKKKTRFRYIDPNSGPQGEYLTKVMPAYCFRYDDLDIALDSTNLSDDSTIVKPINPKQGSSSHRKFDF